MAKSLEVSLPKKGAVYRYVALTSQEKPVKGTINAANEAVAGQLLTERGLKLVSLELQASRLALEQLFPTLFGIKPQEVVSFSRQLATLLESGITLVSALELIQQQPGSRAFKRVLTTMVSDLRTGISFSEALAKHPQVFNEIYCRTIATAERAGGLETILRQIADYQEKQGVAMKKVTGALTYPAIILGLGLCVVALLISTALPPLVNMFTQLEVNLPLPTRILIAVTNFVSAYKLYLLGFVVLLVAAGIWFIKQPSGRLRFDRTLLRTPLIGPPMHSAEVARFSRTASVLLSAGLPLQEIIDMLPQTSGNRAMRRSLSQVHQDLIRGEGVSEPMSRDDIFPPLLTQMVRVGEESNTLDSTLGVAADFYESDAEERISSLVRFIQPASTVFIALTVGFIALSIIMPMYTITGAFD